jgi:hypothetical protein
MLYCLDAIEEEDDADLPLDGDETAGDWPWVNGLESDVEDSGVDT